MTDGQIIQQINEHITKEVDGLRDDMREDVQAIHVKIDTTQEQVTTNKTDIDWLKKMWWKIILIILIGSGTAGGTLASVYGG